MDFRRLIESTRENVQRAQASYSDAAWRVDRIKKPLRCYLFMDRRFDPQFRDQRILLERGAVAWGSIIQANEILFQKNGPHASLPAAIIYSADPFYDADPESLITHAQNMFELKGETCTPEMQAFGDKLVDEMVADIKLPIPTGFTEGLPCYYATLMIARKHVPGNYLAKDLFPVLIAPEETDAVMILPRSYWDSELASIWTES